MTETNAIEQDGPVPLPELETQKALLQRIDEALQAQPLCAGEIAAGKVTAISDDYVTVDLGHECLSEINRDEFIGPDGVLGAAVDDEVDIYLEAWDSHGVLLSREKATKLAVWDRISAAVDSHELMEGTITGRVKGGLSVDIGFKAFLPGSQVDLRPSRNLDKYIGQTLEFQVVKFNRKRGNVVLSRRAQLEKERAGLKGETLEKLEVGVIMDGVVKNLTDYGCFVDLGGIDGLLHVTDMSWGRINHPKQLVKPGDDIRVQVLRFDPETERVSLGVKQMTEDPWEHADRRYREGQRLEGRVVSVAEFGAFVALEDGIEGLIHVSEMSWTRRIGHAREVVKVGEDVEAVILGIDHEARRISLGTRQLQPNPWTLLQDKYPVGTAMKAKVRSVTNFGIFLGIEEGIDGLVHVSDLSWGGKIKDPNDAWKKGDEVEAVVLNIDVQEERFSLGIKQLLADPWRDIEHRYPIGKVVEGRVTKILEFGAIVALEEHIEALVHISEISDEHTEDVAAALAVDQEVRAKVISVVADQRKMGLSIKRLIEAEATGDYSEPQAETRTTIGDLIKEKIDVSALPEGKPPK